MTKRNSGILVLALVLIIGITMIISHRNKPSSSAIKSTENPSLSVSLIQPETTNIPITLTTNGSIAAWQEAIIGAEIGELRLNEVNAQIGEKVKKGQVLASFSTESVLIDIAHSRAALLEAEANQSDAKINAERANKVSISGALSSQQVDQYKTLYKTANAKVELAKAQLNAQLLRLKYTQVLASDDGVISSSNATLGAVATKGQELFRLIRQNRLEWRGEVTAEEITQLKPGIKVTVKVPNVGNVEGSIRFLAPTLNIQNRNGLVYVDLPNATANGLRAGMFGRGEFHIDYSKGLTIPQEAISMRDGFSYVFILTNQTKDRGYVKQVKVQLGRKFDNKLEILSGITTNDYLVASGAAFLTDGDNVRIITQ